MTLILKSQLMGNIIPVAFATHPMGEGIWRDFRPEGETLAQIIAGIPHLSLAFEDFGLVCVGGAPVPRQYWSRRPGECTRTLTPKARAHDPAWVTLHWKFRDGGGAKKIVSIVAAVALIAVGAFITGGGAAGLFGLMPGFFGAGSTSAFLLAAGVTTLGRLALTMLSPPAARDQRGGSQAPVIGAAGASGNALQPGGPLMRVAGRRKIFPSFASFPLIELTGDDEVAEACYIARGPHKVEDLRIEGAPIASIAGVQYYVNEGLNREVTSILGRYGVQRTPNFELAAHRTDNDVVYRLRNQANPDTDLPTERIDVSTTDPDEMWDQFTWPTGLTDTASNIYLATPIRYRLRILGTTQWLNLPELMFMDNRSGAITKKVVIRWGDPPSPIVDSAQAHGAWQSFHTVPPQSPTGAAPPGTGGWNAHSSFGGGAPYNAATRVVRAYDGFTIYLDENVFPRGQRWEVGRRRGAALAAGNLNPATYDYNSDVFGGAPFSHFDYFISSGFARLPFRRTESTVDRVVLSRFASVKNATPCPLPGDMIIEVKAKAAQLAQLSCIASAYVPDWNGAEWTGSVTSSNPATHARDVLCGAFTDDPLAADQVINAELVAFRQNCIDGDYQVSGAFDGAQWGETLQAIASTGFGRVRAGHRWGMAFDRDTALEDVSQHFTLRNANNFAIEKGFIAAPEAFRVRFQNRDMDWADDEILVIRPGLSRADVRTIDQVNAVALDRTSGVIQRFSRDLLQAYLSDHVLSFDTPPDGLVSQMGDLVGVSLPMMSRHHVAARATAIETDDDGLCIGLVLDNTHEEHDTTNIELVSDVFGTQDIFGQGLQLAAAIVTGEGVITKALVQNGSRRSRIVFETPFDPDGIEPQHLVMIGEAEHIHRRYLIKDVAPAQRFNMRITAIPDHPEAWT